MCATTTTTGQPARRARLWDGDTFTHRGYTFRARIERDDDMGPPWEEHDGHGPVSDWTHREKRPGERVLVSDGYGRSRRYYDFQEAVRQAKREQWGPVHCAVCGGEAGGIGTPAYATIHETEPADHPFTAETAAATAARAAERDFEYLRGWCRDEWEWLAVDVEHIDDGKRTGLRESLGGIDGDHDDGRYVTDVCYELADQIINASLEIDRPDVIKGEN